MKGQWMRVVGAITCLWVAGCQTPGAVGAGALSASGSSDSNSGNSSQSNSGNSSQSNSGNSSDSNSGQSASSESSGGSSESSEPVGQWSTHAVQASEGSTNNSADTTRGSSENSESSQSRSSQTTSGPVLSVTMVGATVGGLGLVIWQVLKAVPTAPTPADVGQAAQVYLRSRTHQLREDLALGAGPTIEDLAAMARIRRENLRTFGRLLREHRGELLALAADSTLTPERALVWLERVGQLARTEPRLAEDRRAFLAAHGLAE